MLDFDGVNGQVTRVVSRDAPLGREPDLDAWIHRVVATAARYPGHLDATVLHGGDGESGRHIVIHRWTDEASLRAWESSPELERLREEGDAISRRQLQTATGFETWFALSDLRSPGPPPRWKMHLVTLASAYLLSLLIGTGVGPQLEAAPFMVRHAVVTFVLATSLMFVVLPLLTRLLRRWLYPPRHPEAGQTPS